METIRSNISPQTTGQEADSAAEVEVSPGFFVARRSVLTGLGAGILGLLPALHAQPARSQEAIGKLSFEDFLAQANPLAQQLADLQSGSNQDHYLRSIAALAAHLDEVPVPNRWNNSDQGEAPGSYQIGINPGGKSFIVLHWRLEPGAVCRPHAHTYGIVATIGLAGSARVSNYEVVGEPDYNSTESFQVKQTAEQLLVPGSINLVSLHRNYIHGFVAGPGGARGLDITTRVRPKPEHATPYLAMTEQPSGDFERTFEASWDYGD